MHTRDVISEEKKKKKKKKRETGEDFPLGQDGIVFGAAQSLFYKLGR